MTDDEKEAFENRFDALYGDYFKHAAKGIGVVDGAETLKRVMEQSLKISRVFGEKACDEFIKEVLGTKQ